MTADEFKVLGATFFRNGFFTFIFTFCETEFWDLIKCQLPTLTAEPIPPKAPSFWQVCVQHRHSWKRCAWAC